MATNFNGHIPCWDIRKSHIKPNIDNKSGMNVHAREFDMSEAASLRLFKSLKSQYYYSNINELKRTLLNIDSQFKAL
jgi:hypothetical protein